MNSVTVLMSTYNGEKYLKEQIDSLMLQKNVDMKILVRDDGSSDKTTCFLDDYQDKGVLTWYTGPNLRPAKSFLNLIMNAPKSDYYAFCDQDDVWNEDKLERAVITLEKYGDASIPRLYCANYQLVDANLNNLPDNGHVSTTTFNEALVSSCCTGCTTVFNRALLEILQKGEPDTIVMHDDWCHKVCLAVGGTVYYDTTKVLKYRQHGNNADGGVHSLLHRIIGIKNRIVKGDCIRSNQLKCLYSIYQTNMAYDNKKTLERLIKIMSGSILTRMINIPFLSVRTGYIKKDIGFYIAILFKYF